MFQINWTALALCHDFFIDFSLCIGYVVVEYQTQNLQNVQFSLFQKAIAFSFYHF